MPVPFTEEFLNRRLLAHKKWQEEQYQNMPKPLQALRALNDIYELLKKEGRIEGEFSPELVVDEVKTLLDEYAVVRELLKRKTVN